MIPTAKIACFVLVLFMVQACSVHKRYYRKGWHVEWQQRIAPAAASTETIDVSDRTQNELPESFLPAEAPVIQTIESQQQRSVEAETSYAAASDELASEPVLTEAQQFIPDDDSLVVEAHQPDRRIVSEKEMRNYDLLTASVTLLLLLLVVLCVLFAIMYMSSQSLGAIFIALLLLLFALIFPIIRSTSRPDTIARREEQKRAGERDGKDVLLAEEERVKAARKKRNSAIFFAFFFSTIGTIIFILITTQ